MGGEGASRSRARAEFEAEKNAAYSDLADLMDDHGYEPTVAACADFVGRRVNDEMRDRAMEEDDDGE